MADQSLKRRRLPGRGAQHRTAAAGARKSLQRVALSIVVHQGDAATVTATGKRRVVIVAATQRESEQYRSNECQQRALASLVRPVQHCHAAVQRSHDVIAEVTEAIDVELVQSHEPSPSSDSSARHSSSAAARILLSSSSPGRSSRR